MRKKAKCESCFWNFYSNIDLNTSLDFSFSETYGDEYQGNKSKYAEFITSLNIFKGTINAEFNMKSYWLEKSEI